MRLHRVPTRRRVYDRHVKNQNIRSTSSRSSSTSFSSSVLVAESRASCSELPSVRTTRYMCDGADRRSNYVRSHHVWESRLRWFTIAQVVSVSNTNSVSTRSNSEVRWVGGESEESEYGFVNGTAAVMPRLQAYETGLSNGRRSYGCQASSVVMRHDTYDVHALPWQSYEAHSAHFPTLYRSTVLRQDSLQQHARSSLVAPRAHDDSISLPAVIPARGEQALYGWDASLRRTPHENQLKDVERQVLERWNGTAQGSRSDTGDDQCETQEKSLSEAVEKKSGVHTSTNQRNASEFVESISLVDTLRESREVHVSEANGNASMRLDVAATEEEVRVAIKETQKQLAADADTSTRDTASNLTHSSNVEETEDHFEGLYFLASEKSELKRRLGLHTPKKSSSSSKCCISSSPPTSFSAALPSPSSLASSPPSHSDLPFAPLAPPQPPALSSACFKELLVQARSGSLLHREGLAGDSVSIKFSPLWNETVYRALHDFDPPLREVSTQHPSKPVSATERVQAELRQLYGIANDDVCVQVSDARKENSTARRRGSANYSFIDLRSSIIRYADHVRRERAREKRQTEKEAVVAADTAVNDIRSDTLHCPILPPFPLPVPLAVANDAGDSYEEMRHGSGDLIHNGNGDLAEQLEKTNAIIDAYISRAREPVTFRGSAPIPPR